MAMPRFKDPLADSIRVLKTSTCDSLSGKSRLTYQIGCNADSEIYLRVNANTGGGFFSPEWVSLLDIQRVLDDSPEGEPISSITFDGLFKGKSVNTPAFLTATLVHEKWLRVLKGKKRGLEILDPKPFLAKVEKLVAASGEAKLKPAAKKPSKKTPAKQAKGTAGKKKRATSPES